MAIWYLALRIFIGALSLSRSEERKKNACGILFIFLIDVNKLIGQSKKNCSLFTREGFGYISVYTQREISPQGYHILNYGGYKLI